MKSYFKQFQPSLFKRYHKIFVKPTKNEEMGKNIDFFNSIGMINNVLVDG